MMGNVQERRQVNMAIKQYKKINDEVSRSRYCSFKKEYKKYMCNTEKHS